MAASADVPSNQQQHSAPAAPQQEKRSPSASSPADATQNGGGSLNPSNNETSNSVPAPPPSSATTAAGKNSQQTQRPLKHIPEPGLSTDWSAAEQSLLEELLTKYASVASTIERYGIIAKQLKDKTIRDVALRCRWMTKKENGKRRKEDNSSGRKNKDRREKAADSTVKPPSHISNSTNGPLYFTSMVSVDNDDGISYKDIGGLTGELFEQNSQMFNQISANFASFQIHNNINLFCKTRENILSVLNDMKDEPEVMKQMPPLPVKINEELANTMLPHSSQQAK